MDLGLHFRVLWRFRLLVLNGLILAVVLSMLSFVTVTFPNGFGVPKLQSRQFESWTSMTTLFVTQPGFPAGRSVIPVEEVDTPKKPNDVQFANPDRFVQLAVLYAELAGSDPVRRQIQKGGPLRGTYQAFPVVAQQAQGVVLPMIRIQAVSTTPALAVRLAERATTAFQTYLERRQTANVVPEGQRVIVELVDAADRPTLLSGRSKTMPIVILLVIFGATCGLAFVLENVRPRIQVAADPDQQLVHRGSARRSA